MRGMKAMTVLVAAAMCVGLGTMLIGADAPVATRQPSRAIEADRLIATVVFPQPPFWLATVMVRTSKPSR